MVEAMEAVYRVSLITVQLMEALVEALSQMYKITGRNLAIMAAIITLESLEQLFIILTNSY